MTRPPPRTLTSVWLIQQGACPEGVEWFKFRKVREAHDVLTALIQEGKLDWANWLIVRVMTRRQRLTYAIYAAEQVISLYEQRYPQDSQPRTAIEAARACLTHDTTKNRKAAVAASDAARQAGWTAGKEAVCAADWTAEEVGMAASWSARASSEAAMAAGVTMPGWAGAASRSASKAARVTIPAMQKNILAYGRRVLKEGP